MKSIFSSYLNSLLCVSLTAFILESICTFSSKGKRLSSALGLITSLSIFLTCLSPFIVLIKRTTELKFPEFKDKEQVYSQNEPKFNSLFLQELESRLITEISDKTGIFISSLSISMNENENEDAIFSVKITIEKCYESSKEEIKNILKIHLGENTHYLITETENE